MRDITIKKTQGNHVKSLRITEIIRMPDCVARATKTFKYRVYLFTNLKPKPNGFSELPKQFMEKRPRRVSVVKRYGQKESSEMSYRVIGSFFVSEMHKVFFVCFMHRIRFEVLGNGFVQQPDLKKLLEEVS